MGWIQKLFERRMHSDDRMQAKNTAQISFETLAGQKWQELVTGLKHDVGEYRSLGGGASLSEDSDLSCRITNAKTSVTALIVADPVAYTVQYTFTSEVVDNAVHD